MSLKLPNLFTSLLKSSVLKSPHWLKIEQRIQYKVASITYKVLQSDNLLIFTAFSMFNLTVLLAPLTSSLSNVRQFAYVSKYLTGLLPTMLLYFGILYPNNCGNLRRLHHSSLLLILLLHLPCPRISFTLNSKCFSLNNPFLLSLVCTNSCRFSGPLI